jgi:hypothetical protein
METGFSDNARKAENGPPQLSVLKSITILSCGSRDQGYKYASNGFVAAYKCDGYDESQVLRVEDRPACMHLSVCHTHLSSAGRPRA